MNYTGTSYFTILVNFEGMVEGIIATTAVTVMKAAVTGVTGALGAQWYKQQRTENEKE